MMNIDEARIYLMKVHNIEFSGYIDFGLDSGFALAVAEDHKRMAERIEALEGDERRLDWLADVNNQLGNVVLPTTAVERNIHNMRAAIDEAMRE